MVNLPFKMYRSAHLMRFLHGRRGGQPQSQPPFQKVRLLAACHRAGCPGTTLLQGQHDNGALIPTLGDSRHEYLLGGEGEGGGGEGKGRGDSRRRGEGKKEERGRGREGRGGEGVCVCVCGGGGGGGGESSRLWIYAHDEK